MGDWADEKVREWYQGGQEDFRYEGPVDGSGFASLAALLREVKVGEYPCVDCGCLTILKPDQYKWDILAEVRRVVQDVYARDYDIPRHKRDEILSRLEKL